MGLNDIRESFLAFFESKGHLRLPSFPLIPKDDKSLLLINSGMAPQKKWFLGQEEPPCHRTTTCQKCIRTPDIDNVGKDDRHGTYFEMLGNFSFGDYFKKRPSAGHGNISPRSSSSRRTSSTSPSMKRMTRPMTSGTTRSASPRIASFVSARRTTSGRSAPAPAGPARKSTSTAARNTDAADRTAPSAASATATSRSGISSSLSSTPTAKATTSAWRTRTSTPAWALSALPA